MIFVDSYRTVLGVIMKIFLSLVIAVCGAGLLSSSALAQRRPLEKPVPVAKPSVSELTTAANTLSSAEAYYNEGLKCEAQDYDCQVSNFTKAINLNLATKAVFQRRANAYTGRGDYEKALADLSKVTELDPNDASGFKNRGTAYLRMPKNRQNLQNAAKDFAMAVDLEPKDAEAIGLRGRALILLGDTSKGIQDLETATRLDPQNIGNHLYKAQIFTLLDDDQKTFEAYSKAVSLQPSNPDALVGRARLLEKQKKFDLARNDYTKASLISTSIAAHFGLARLFEQEGKIDDAVAEYSKAIKIEPSNSEAIFKRATLLGIRKKNSEALADLTRLIELNPANDKAYELRCRIHRAAGIPLKAVEDCSIAISLNPNLVEGYALRADILKNVIANLQATSSGHPLSFLTIYPQLKPAWDLLGSDQINRAKNMRISAGVAMRMAKPNALHLVMLGIGESDSYQNELAEEHLTRAIEIGGEVADAFAGRARVLHDLQLAKNGTSTSGAGRGTALYISSVQDYLRAATIDPHNEIVLDSLNTKFDPGFSLPLDGEGVEFYKPALELLSRLVDANPKDARPLFARAMLRNQLLSIEGEKRTWKQCSGTATNKMHRKLRDEDWNGTKTGIVSDLRLAIEGCRKGYASRVVLPLTSAEIRLSDYGPEVAGLLKGCRSRIETENGGREAIIAEIVNLYKAAERGSNLAQSLTTILAASVSAIEREIRQQETQRVIREDTAWRQKMIVQNEAFKLEADRYAQQVEAMRQKQSAERARQNAEALNALLNLASTVVDTIAARSSTNSTSSSGSPYQNDGPIPGGNVRGNASSTPIGSGSPSGELAKGGTPSSRSHIYDVRQDSVDNGCSRGSAELDIERCWGPWQSAGASVVQFRVKGPIAHKGNLVNQDATKNVYYEWAVQFKNSSANVVCMDVDMLPPDGRTGKIMTCMIPGGTQEFRGTEYQRTLVRSGQFNMRSYNLEVCQRAERVDSGTYRCLAWPGETPG
jgi:tetratricopeptide (TPR) repeat protein